MMSSEEFSSTEELYYEGSVEPLYDYHQESQLRYHENVVYIPHVFSPVMLVEYVPVFYNYLTYEPYLMNSYQVMYIPFIRQISYTYFVPYYYHSTAPEVFSSYTPAVFSSYTQNETDSNSSQESIFDQASSDELDYEGDFSSSISYSGDTSILSLSSSDPSSSCEYSVFNSTQETSEFAQGFVCTENNDCFDEENNMAREYPERLFSAADEDVSTGGEGCSSSLLLEKYDKDPAELDCPGNYLDHIPFNEERGVEYDGSSISSFVHVETSDSSEELVKLEASSFKDRNLSPERRENHSVFNNDIETRDSNASSLEYVDKCQDKNGLEHQERSPLINEKNTKYDSDTSSSNMLMWSHEKPLQKQYSPHETDVKVSDPFDYVMSENENDTHDDPGITLEDVFASEEYWSVKREEYSRKTRNNELYKSALQGDIRPRKSLPDVGKMDTIFEDLPYPVNEPYDDGQESKDAYFDLAPLEVQRSMSSKTALLPKKKRFGKTKKFFSQLFGCFRPP